MNKLFKRTAGLFIMALLSCAVSDSLSADNVTLTTIMPSGYSTPTVYYSVNTNIRQYNLPAGYGVIYDTHTLTMPVIQNKYYRVYFSGEASVPGSNNTIFLGIGLGPTYDKGTPACGTGWAINSYSYVGWQSFTNVYIIRADVTGTLQFRPMAWSFAATTYQLTNTNLYAEEVNAINKAS